MIRGSLRLCRQVATLSATVMMQRAIFIMHVNRMLAMQMLTDLNMPRNSTCPYDTVGCGKKDQQ